MALPLAFLLTSFTCRKYGHDTVMSEQERLQYVQDICSNMVTVVSEALVVHTLAATDNVVSHYGLRP